MPPDAPDIDDRSRDRPTEGARRPTRVWIVAGVVALAFAVLAVIGQSQRDGGDSAPEPMAPVGTEPSADASHDAPSDSPDTSASTTDDATGDADGDAGSTPQGDTGEAADDPGSTTPGPTGEELWVVRREPGDPLAVGDVDAPVVLVEWLDLRCPFCALFSRTTLPTLLADYIDAGLVRYEVHTVEFFGDQSREAAVAVLAAGEQGVAHEYLQAVYAAAPERGHPDLTRDVLIGFAEQVGVGDIATFTTDLDREDLAASVQEQTAVAGSLGINTVPFFLVNDLAIAGAQPIEVFREVLDDAIGAARG